MDLIQRKACRYNLRPRKRVPCYCDGSRRTKRTKWHDIPEDIKRIILLKLPAELIYDVMRCVCTNLRCTILHDSSFVNSHLRDSNPGLILRSLSNGGCFEFVEATNPNGDEVVVSHRTLNYSGSGFISSTCNGLILVCEYIKHEWEFCILNPVTKQKLIPPISSLTSDCQLGYVASTGEYKMVKHTGLFDNKTHSVVEILTLGPNQGWRYLCNWPSTLTDRYSAGGLIYWIEIEESRLVSLNLETEALRELPYPSVNRKKFLVMGDQLSVVNWEGEKRLFFEVWVLVEEQHNDAVWMKVCDIDLQCWKCVFERICNCSYVYPVGWLRAMEVIVFSVGCHQEIYIAYDIKTQKIHPFRVKGGSLHGVAHSFVKSLVSPDAIRTNS